MSPRTLVFAIPGDLDTPTGGYAYDRHLINELPSHGWEVGTLRLGDSFPHPAPADISHAAAVLAGVPHGSVVMVDGLALGALDPDTLTGVSVPLVGLVHHPLAFEGYLDQATRDRLHYQERESLARCHHIIVTSPSTATLLEAHYDVDRSRMTVARPGVNPPSLPPSPQDPPLLLSVGSLTPRKGHDVLVRALALLTDLSWTAVIAGQARDEAYAWLLKKAVGDLELGNRVSFPGAVSDTQLETLYSQATAFVLATRFEGHGMVFDEAMAHGVPIVSCHTGAVPDTVAPGAGLLVPVDDPEALADALRSLLTDPALRQTVARASESAGHELPSWSDTAETVARVLDRVSAETLES